VIHDADECHDETVLRMYGGHIVRVPCSLEEVVRWLGPRLLATPQPFNSDRLQDIQRNLPVLLETTASL